ncbi:YibE/F family protein [Cellulomonas triticagri]|uniref:YibE/F family protein n=1 Tax=Cellulomonas triticagri TaxID=2483352 RepID=UPI001F1BB2FA|nr:YibE/F family protein [Cellulomonas triticagri]
MVVVVLLVLAAAVTVAGLVALWPGGDRPVLETAPEGSSYSEVTVTDVELLADSASGPVLLADDADGEQIMVQVAPEYLDVVEAGDRIRVLNLPVAEGVAAPYVFVDLVRGPPMALLAAVMGVLVLVVARLRGLGAIAGLVVSVGGVLWFTVPALVEGRPALPVALVTASALMFVLLYLAHGVSVRTSTALLGTLGGLVATAGLAAWATGATHLNFLGGEYAMDLRSLAPEADLRGILLCGIVLAGLGVLNDVTITQVSAVWELRAASPASTRRDLFRGGMRIGRDHIASTVYTVAFAYLGAALPLVILVAMSDRTLLDTLTSGEIAEEVVRTMVGSIGLVLAIPLTTAIAALLVPAAEPTASPASPEPSTPSAPGPVADPATP